MQIYLNGYTLGDADIRPAAPGAEKRPAGLTKAVDVLIQYVANVLPLDAHGEPAVFFGKFMLDRHRQLSSAA